MAQHEALGISAALVAVVVTACASGNPHPSPGASTSPVASAPISVPSPSPTPFVTVPLPVSKQLNLGAQFANAMSVDSGLVWIATQGVSYGDPGTLLRVDASSARETASWMIGGDPVAIAAAGAYVWVANSYGDGSAALPEQNTVEQFDATSGALVHVYRVLDPRGLVANATSALVISAPTQGETAISLLSTRSTHEIARLPGSLEVLSTSTQAGVAVCGNQVYVALSNALASGSNTTIYSMPPTGTPARKVGTVPNDYEPEMVCAGGSVYLTAVTGPAEGSLARINVTDGAVSELWTGPNPQALAAAAGRLWITYLAGTGESAFLTSLDPVTGIESQTRWFLPAPPNRGDPDLLITDASGLWTVGGVGNVLLHIAIG